MVLGKLGGFMNCRLKKIIMIFSIAAGSVLMTGCNDSAEKRMAEAESYIKGSNDFKGALNVLDEALEEYSGDDNLMELKDEVSIYLTAKECYYNNDFQEALEYLKGEEEVVSGNIMEEPYNELRERIEKQEESKKKKESTKSKDYLKDCVKISAEEADFSIEQAFEIFLPYEEVSPNESEYESLAALPSRTPEQEARLAEIKESILGASTISSNVYKDSQGVFRIGSQHYLFSSTGNRIIYKVYKEGLVTKIN